MKIIHTADLHLGKIVNGYSMLDEQANALKQIINYIKQYNVETLLISGDVYDKKTPSESAVLLFDNFIYELSNMNINVLIISGNHDSGLKLQFANKLLSKQSIHIIGLYNESLSKIQLEDDYGLINFYLLPFIKPSDIRKYDESIKTYDDAVSYVINNEHIDYMQRNIFLGHQFYASGNEEISDSEIISVGGSDNVAYNHLIDFDYAALGHLHKAQKLKSEFIRYSGSIVPYSESEVNVNKSVVLLDIKEKANINYQLLPLNQIHKFRSVKAHIKDILNMDNSLDYVFVTLLDDHVVDAMSKLRLKFPNIMSLDFDNTRTRENQVIDIENNIDDISKKAMFENFYNIQNNTGLNDNQQSIVDQILERLDDNASN